MTVRIGKSSLKSSSLTNFSDDVGAFTYGHGHPMKPHRIRITHDLVTAYDMLGKMHVLVCFHLVQLKYSAESDTQRPKRASPEAMTCFHTDEYIHFLNRVTPETAEELTYHGTRCESIVL
jgi:histone deacetylase 1/2